MIGEGIEMNGINPDEIGNSYDTVGFQGGNLSMSISTPEIKPSSMEISFPLLI